MRFLKPCAECLEESCNCNDWWKKLSQEQQNDFLDMVGMISFKKNKARFVHD